MIASLALVLREPGTRPVLEEVQVSDPAAGQVRVRIVASGICATDVHALTGEQPIQRFPVILGHEGAGIIESVGPGVDGLSVGDHVVLALSSPCGACRACRRGRSDECDSEWRRTGFAGVQMDGRSTIRQREDDIFPLFGVGTLTEYTTVRASQAIKIDAELPLDLMCLTGCCVVTGVGAAIHTAQVEPGDSVLVVGCGGVGLNIIQGARIAGATTIIAADVDAAALDLARRLGATHVVDSRREELDVRAIVPDGVDFAFEVVGSPALIVACLDQTRIGGTCVLVGLTAPGATVPVDARVLNGARRLVGCRGGGGVPAENIAMLSRFYRDGELRLAELVGPQLDFVDVLTGFDSFGRSGPGRTVIKMV
ncbi:alcohol dehydrogenase catalytic domain-containing protein [Aeromicrobium sp. P5_D10]